MCTSTCAVFLGFLVFANGQADDFPPPPEPIKIQTGSPTNVPPAPFMEVKPAVVFVDAPFGKIIKDSLLKNLPRDLVVQKEHDWGHQAHVPSIQGVRLIEVLRNHGNWERMKLICPDVPHRLQVTVDGVSFPGQDRMGFFVQVDVQADVEFEKQIWQNGLQIFVGHSRGRVRFKIEAAMEGTLAQGWPELKVGKVTICCYDFVAENVNGVGGDLGRMSGGNFQKTFKQYQARFEHDVLAKFRDAIFKAGASAEVAFGWARLYNAVTAPANLAQVVHTTALPAEGQPCRWNRAGASRFVLRRF
jgi:hypothetical protein